jgi:formylmethanofuran dehydrogenase subunit C
MSLRLRYRAETTVPVEVEGITPEAVAGSSLADVQRRVIYHGNREVPLAEMFDVSGDPSSGRIDWEGDLSGVHWIGAAMTRGTTYVAGNAGRHLGTDMTGGEIHVEGNAGDWVGGEMQGGSIRVRGDAGHLVGSAYRGSARGMAGGTILIGGRVGNEVGHTMRRGLIAAGGECGDVAGMNMIAGTILVFGTGGIRHGAAMRRGTIGLLGQTDPQLLPTFRHACRCRPQVLRMLLAWLTRQDFPVPEQLFDADFDLHHGDFLEGGRGEIFSLAT